MNIFRNFAAKSNDKATMAKQKPKDELTTGMHYEFLEDMGVDRKSFMIYSASGMIERTGCSKEEACRKHGITVKEYDENIDRVLHTDDWWDTDIDRARKLALKSAAEYDQGYDIVSYIGDYKGGMLFAARKSSVRGRYAGFPLRVLVKDSKAECLSLDECWELFYHGIPSQSTDNTADNAGVKK